MISSKQKNRNTWLANMLAGCFSVEKGVSLMNEENLKPIRHLSSDEAKRRGAKGGKASGEARRRRKLIKEQMEIALSLPVSNKKIRKTMEDIGLDEEEMDNQMALVLAMIQQGCKGDVGAFNSIRDLMGEKPQDKVELSGEVNNPYKDLTTEDLKKLINDG